MATALGEAWLSTDAGKDAMIRLLWDLLAVPDRGRRD